MSNTASAVITNDVSIMSKNKSSESEVCLHVNDLSLFYGESQALHNVSFEMKKNHVTAFIGPSGCGKSTLLRCFNRMNDLIDDVRVTGEIVLDGKNIFDSAVDVTALRQRVGMVFQKPNPFPMSIFENVAYGLRLQGVNKRRVLEEKVEWALKGAALWDEVKDRLDQSALGISGGQQQRVALARALITKPDVLLLDEPLSALDPFLRVKMRAELKRIHRELGLTFIHVTHSQEEAMALADMVVVMNGGRIEQAGSPWEVFNRPKTEFVARFIGGHNVISGRVTRAETGDTSLAVGAYQFIVPHINAAEGSEVIFSVRADRVSLALEAEGPGSINALRATVRFVEYQGTQVRIGLECQESDEFSIMISDREFLEKPVSIGDQITATWEVSDAHCVGSYRAQASSNSNQMQFNQEILHV